MPTKNNGFSKLTVRDGYAKWSLPNMAQNVHHTERLELLSMLERDGKVPPSKAVCTGCADTHDRSLFFKRIIGAVQLRTSLLGQRWACMDLSALDL